MARITVYPGVALWLVFCVTAATWLGIWLGRHARGSVPLKAPESTREAGYADATQASGRTSALSDLVIEPKDASCRVYEEVTSPVFKFSLSNKGTRTLRIQNIIPACGCTTAELATAELEPGESTTLRVVYEAISLFGELPRRTITVRTDEQGVEPAICTVGGIRERRFKVEPPSVQLGVVLAGSTPTRQVTVEACGPGVQLTPERMVVDNPWITARLVRQEPGPDGGARLVVNIGISQAAPVGKLDGRLFIPRVQDDGIGPLVPLMADISGPLELHPSRAFMGLMKVGTRAERKIEVRRVATTGQPVRVTGFGECPPGISIQKDESNTALVRIATDASQLPPGQFDHKVIVKAQVEELSYDLVLHVSGMVVP